MGWSRSCARVSGALLWLVTGAVLAEPLRLDRSAETMRVDGALREWKGARFATLGVGDDASLRYALAGQGDGLYVGAEIRDDQLVRKASAGPGQDALVLSLAFPSAAGGLRGAEVWLHAGRVGREKALAALRPLDAKAAPAPAPPELKVVEGPLAGGYVIEAFIPWRLLAGAEAGWEQARARLRYEDVDRAGQKAAEDSLATSSAARPGDWPEIVLGTGQNDLLAAFLQAQGLSGVAPRFDARADVAGDASEERVVIVDKFVLVYGKGFKQGQGYSYFALPYSVGGGLVGAALIDLTGDGRAELVTRVRQVNPLGARVLLSVLALGEDRIAPLFSLELKKETREGFIENELRIDEKARPRRLEQSLGRAQGLSEQNFREDPAGDAQPILLPWGPLEAVSYAFQGGSFTRVDQRARKRTPEPAPSAPPAQAADTRGAPATRVEPAPSSGDPIADLISGLGRGGPGATAALRFKQETNVIGGSARELVFVHQRRIVVSGADLGGAGSYLAYGLPVRADEDLLSLSSADLGKDGKSELLARYRQLGAGGVTHELLAVLALEASGPQRGFRPLLVAEVARRQQDKAIVNEVQVASGVLAIAPGKAQGYTRESYPFDNEAMSGIERLLLPWLDGPRRYRLEAGRLRAE